MNRTDLECLIVETHLQSAEGRYHYISPCVHTTKSQHYRRKTRYCARIRSTMAANSGVSSNSTVIRIYMLTGLLMNSCGAHHHRRPFITVDLRSARCTNNMASKTLTRRTAFSCALLFSSVLALSIAGCGGSSDAERVKGEAGGTPATGSDGKTIYKEDPSSKAAGGSGMPLPTTR